MPRSSNTARQNHSRSAVERARRASKLSIRWRRMNAVSRLRSMTSGDGRHAISPPNSKALGIREILSRRARQRGQRRENDRIETMAKDALSVIVSACRTPIGTFGGSLKDVQAADLGAVVIREALARGGTA